MTTKTLAGYCRTSLTKQEQSIAHQKEEIQKYADAYGFKVKFFIDEGMSAYKHRPKFEAMMENLAGFDGVIVTDLTRFGRSTWELLGSIKTIQDKGLSFITIKQQINTDTKEGKLMLTVLAAIADFEKDTIRERLEWGREHAKTHGTKSGLPMHRPRKEVNWREFDKQKEQRIPVSKIAKNFGMSKSTLYDRIKERAQVAKEKPII
jgi:DNA invertase Pin-like site-specific DNA recombinase